MNACKIAVISDFAEEILISKYTKMKAQHLMCIVW
jgi:hypothetical protein